MLVSAPTYSGPVLLVLDSNRTTSGSELAYLDRLLLFACQYLPFMVMCNHMSDKLSGTNFKGLIVFSKYLTYARVN